MKSARLLLALALGAAPAPAWTQMYKCKDARGKIEYVAMPRAGCTDMSGKPVQATQRAAPAPAAKAKSTPKLPAFGPATKAQSAPQPAAKKAATVSALPADPRQRAIDCRGLRQQRDWLMGPVGRKTENREARLAQVDQAMRGCR